MIKKKSADNEYNLSPQIYKDLLNNNTDELSALKFFRKYPWPLFWSICTSGGHFYYMIPEFNIGTQFKTDFLIINSFSGVWELHFIELEPIGDPLFNKNGSYAKRLNGAISQINDWVTYYNANKQSVINEIIRLINKKDILNYCEPQTDPVNWSGNHLSDPNSFIHDQYHIMIGKSSEMTKEETTRKAIISSKNHINIITYDRILSIMERRYPLNKEERHPTSASIIKSIKRY